MTVTNIYSHFHPLIDIIPPDKLILTVNLPRIVHALLFPFFSQAQWVLGLVRRHSSTETGDVFFRNILIYILGASTDHVAFRKRQKKKTYVGIQMRSDLSTTTPTHEARVGRREKRNVRQLFGGIGTVILMESDLRCEEWKKMSEGQMDKSCHNFSVLSWSWVCLFVCMYLG